MEITNIKIEDIKVYEKNAKEHPEYQISQIADSIKAFGFNDPIAIDENNVIIEGHGRLYAGKKLGMKELPCIKLSHLTPEQRKAYIIAHNKLTMNTGFDFEILKDELEFLDDDLRDLTGFNPIEIDAIIEDLTPEKFDKGEYREFEENAKSGLGKHILISYENREELDSLITMLGIPYKPNRTTYTMEEILKAQEEE